MRLRLLLLTLIVLTGCLSAQAPPVSQQAGSGLQLVEPTFVLRFTLIGLSGDRDRTSGENCVSLEGDQDPVHVAGGTATAEWDASTPAARTLSLGVSHFEGEYKASITGTSPLELELPEMTIHENSSWWVWVLHSMDEPVTIAYEQEVDLGLKLSVIGADNLRIEDTWYCSTLER